MYVSEISSRFSRGMSTPAIRAIRSSPQPWRCLCRGFSQITITTPWRRMILHFSQIGLTLGLTFTSYSSTSLVAVRDATPGEVIGGELHLNPVTRQDPDVVHPHLPGNMRQHLVAVLELHPEHGIRERLDNGSFHEDRIVFGLRQGDSPTLPRFRRRERPAGRSSQTAQYKRLRDATAKPSCCVAFRGG